MSRIVNEQGGMSTGREDINSLVTVIKKKLYSFNVEFFIFHLIRRLHSGFMTKMYRDPIKIFKNIFKSCNVLVNHIILN